MLAEKLNMTPEHAEKWIVNLIRNARLDAKIDSQLVIIVAPFFFFLNLEFNVIIKLFYVVFKSRFCEI